MKDKMTRILALLVGLLFVLPSCKEEEEKPAYSGEIILSSERLPSGNDFVYYGFSFETGKVSTYSITSSVRPDLTVNHVSLGGQITSVYLEGSDEDDAFFQNGEFESGTGAQAWFDNYTDVLAEDFIPLALELKVNQVWTIQTAGKRYAKILIKEITTQTGSQSDFANVKLQYVYQPDGSRTFHDTPLTQE